MGCHPLNLWYVFIPSFVHEFMNPFIDGPVY